MSKIKTFIDSTVKNVCKQIRQITGFENPVFHDVYVQMQQVDTDGKATADVDLTTAPGRIKAFVKTIEANTELGTQAGRYIRAYVKTEVNEHTSLGDKKPKRTSLDDNLIIFHVFDNGTTKGTFAKLSGAIERNELSAFGDNLHEITEDGALGRCIYPSYPPFYLRNEKGEIMMGKRKNLDGTYTASEKRQATSRPLFLQANELVGLETRIRKEVERMDFVNTDAPAQTDDSHIKTLSEEEKKVVDVEGIRKLKDAGKELTEEQLGILKAA